MCLISGVYEVFGNSVEYLKGDEEGYDLDSREYIPLSIIEAVGELIEEYE